MWFIYCLHLQLECKGDTFAIKSSQMWMCHIQLLAVLAVGNSSVRKPDMNHRVVFVWFLIIKREPDWHPRSSCCHLAANVSPITQQLDDMSHVITSSDLSHDLTVNCVQNEALNFFLHKSCFTLTLRNITHISAMVCSWSIWHLIRNRHYDSHTPIFSRHNNVTCISD
jgi:hypothetical protein